MKGGILLYVYKIIVFANSIIITNSPNINIFHCTSKYYNKIKIAIK
jgi:hypothetical protein